MMGAWIQQKKVNFFILIFCVVIAITATHAALLGIVREECVLGIMLVLETLLCAISVSEAHRQLVYVYIIHLI